MVLKNKPRASYVQVTELLINVIESNAPQLLINVIESSKIFQNHALGKTTVLTIGREEGTVLWWWEWHVIIPLISQDLESHFKITNQKKKSSKICHDMRQ